MGLAFLKEFGFAGLARLRFGPVFLDGAIGSMPVLVLYQNVYGSTLHTELGMSLHAAGSFGFFFSNQEKRFMNGLRFMGIYDSICGGGGGVGWVGELQWTRFVLSIGAGIQYYPEYDKRVRAHFDIPSGVQADETGLGGVQPYLGVGTYFYLF